MRSARLLAIVLLLSLAGSAASSTYTLRWGDTLGRLATRYKVPLVALTATNRIDKPNRVREGLTIQIPDHNAAQVALAKPIAAVVPDNTSPSTYTLQAGDTLSALAGRFGVSVDDLVAANGFKNADALLREGRSITLPAGANATSTPPSAPSADQPLCPVVGASKFDFSNSFGAPREGHRRHQGNDIFAKIGTPVVASTAGTIRPADGGRAGIAYYLDGADGTTYYGAHMNARKISAGHVERGDVVGAVGVTGNATGTPAHLHFEVHPNGGDAVDPFKMLQAWCH